MKQAQTIKIGSVEVSNSLPFTLIAGPCQIESEDHALRTASRLKEITTKLGTPLIYKSSFDKANRSSINSKRGVGIEEGLKILQKVRSELNIPTLTDVHLPDQCQMVAEVCDVLQIPAFLCRQTDLLVAAGKTGKAINIKKGQFLSPSLMEGAAQKVRSTGNDKIMLCERGTMFGYDNLVVDMRSLAIMKQNGCPVVFDATHSVQRPGSNGSSSGGEPKFIPTLATAAVATGIAALFMETHEDPTNAPSDGDCMIALDKMDALLGHLKKVDDLAKSEPLPTI